MAKDQLRDLHLFAMESVLPFGMGIINNAKTGGLKKIMDVCRSKDPFSEFLVDGEMAANTVRDTIDKIIPGLGHPVVSVDVTVDQNYSGTVDENYSGSEMNDQDSLVATLNRIDNHLDILRHYLENDSYNFDEK